MTQSVEASTVPSPLPVPKEIIVKETGTTVAYACPGAKCGLLFLFAVHDTDEDKKRKYEEASTHCVKKCVCGRDLDRPYILRCSTCRKEKEAQKEQRAFERATPISMDDYPNHPIYWEGHAGDMGGDGYFSDLDALCEYCEENDIELPKYVWACVRRDVKVSARDLVTDILEHHDIDPEASTLPDDAYVELQQFMNTWIAANAAKLHGWFQDPNRVVLLRETAETG